MVARSRKRPRPATAPERGDVVWYSLGETLGHEQRGRRPGVVLSPASYNKISGLALVCPITPTEKPYPFRVPVAGRTVRGFAIADQPRSIAWVERKIKAVDRVSEAQVSTIVAHLSKLTLGE